MKAGWSKSGKQPNWLFPTPHLPACPETKKISEWRFCPIQTSKGKNGFLHRAVDSSHLKNCFWDYFFSQIRRPKINMTILQPQGSYIVPENPSRLCQKILLSKDYLDLLSAEKPHGLQTRITSSWSQPALDFMPWSPPSSQLVLNSFCSSNVHQKFSYKYFFKLCHCPINDKLFPCKWWNIYLYIAPSVRCSHWEKRTQARAMVVFLPALQEL